MVQIFNQFVICLRIFYHKILFSGIFYQPKGKLLQFFQFHFPLMVIKSQSTLQTNILYLIYGEIVADHINLMKSIWM